MWPKMCECAGARGKTVAVLLCLVFLCRLDFGYCISDRSKREIIEDSVQSYLMKYGYLSPNIEGAGALRTEESVRQAVSNLQAFAGLPVTGRVDEKTAKLLRTPRCGLPDTLPRSELHYDRRRRKRFTLHEGRPWSYTNLTWSLRSTNIPNVDAYEARLVFAKALDVWARHSKLTFTEVNSDRADILIYFHRGDHGDNFAFDGKGQILAHAFFPGPGRGGDAHFDMDEVWLTNDVDNSGEGTNLFKVAAHEFGHSLGLSHSAVDGALMAPWYQGVESENYELPEDDRLGIQALYGSIEGRSWDTIPRYHPPPTAATTTTTPRTRPTRPPERPYYPYYPRYPHPPHKPHPEKPYTPHHPRKPMHPDRKHHPKFSDKPYSPYPSHPTKDTDKYPGRGYPTRAPQVYPERRTSRWYPEATPERPPVRVPPRPTERTTERTPVRSYPTRAGVSPTTKPPPDTCDTSFDAVAVIRREVFFFKDAYFWRIGDSGLLSGYPALITRMWDIKRYLRNFTHVDAVYERPDNKIVFFIGDKFYMFTGNRLENGYPRPLTDLGLPADLKKIDGATVWGHNGRTFFFSGKKYWRYDEDLKKVELDYPRSMNMWKGVGNNIDAVFQWKDGKTYFFKGKGFWRFNDLRMRVDVDEQIPSGPFWMGCTRNFQTYQPSKERYIDDNSVSGSSPPGTNFSVVMALGVILKLYAQIT